MKSLKKNIQNKTEMFRFKVISNICNKESLITSDHDWVISSFMERQIELGKLPVKFYSDWIMHDWYQTVCKALSEYEKPEENNSKATTR